MKKFIAWFLVLALTAAVSIGATLAYLTDTDEDVNVMTVGKVKIDQLEYERIDTETADEDATVQEFHDNKPLYPAVTDKDFDYTPGDTFVDWEQIGKDGYTSEIWNPDEINNEVDKMVFVKNKGNYDAFVRTVFAFEAGNYETLAEFQEMVHLNINEEDWTWNWLEEPVTIGGSTYFIATATYNEVLEPGAITEISLSQISLDKTATNEDVKAFGETYQVLVKSQGIQADGFADAATALDEGFGMILADDVPFESDNPVKGGNVNNAIHYLNADPANTKITDNVTSIVFGKNKDYPQIVNNYKGYLVDAEQDTDTYVYYVPGNAKAAGSTYTVYFLNDDVIYLPKSSRLLFNKMSNLESIDTSNLDTSRVETMYAMFQKCVKLKELDVSKWDVSNVTDLTGTFINCNVLEELKGIENWNTSSVTTMLRMFENCYVLDSWDLNGWNTSNVTDMKGVFKNCYELTSIDLSNWNTSKVTTMHDLFVGCKNLTEVKGMANWDVSKVSLMISMFYDCVSLTTLDDIGNWDTSSLTDNGYMFNNCQSLEKVDCYNWDVSKVTSMMYIFNSCKSLTEVDVSGWDVGNVQYFQAAFRGCPNLTELDVSNWDTSSATNMAHMFAASIGLEYLDVSKWNVENVVYFNAMFQGAGSNKMDVKLKELDVSNWNPVSAVYMNHMFYGCAQLTELDFSNWNTPNLYTTSHMMADCIRLETINTYGWQTTSSWYSMDAMFNDCRKVKFLDLSTFNTAGVVEFSQLFEACWSLEEIKGLTTWNTANGKSFDQTFLSCGSLKELDLSTWDTGSAMYGNTHLNGDTSTGFESTFSGMNSLEKLVLGENFDFDGNGTVTHVAKLPSPAKIDGQATKWYNAENDTYYAASEIPDHTAATYVAAVPPANP